MKNSTGVKSAAALLSFVSIMLVMLSFGSPAQAQERLDNDLARVIGKSPDCIVITDHKFAIRTNNIMVSGAASTLYDVDGKAMSLANLKIPCVAFVRLYQKRNSPEVELIELRVKEYDAKAEKHFTKQQSCKRLPE